MIYRVVIIKDASTPLIFKEVSATIEVHQNLILQAIQHALSSPYSWKLIRSIIHL